MPSHSVNTLTHTETHAHATTDAATQTWTPQPPCTAALATGVDLGTQPAGGLWAPMAGGLLALHWFETKLVKPCKSVMSNDTSLHTSLHIRHLRAVCQVILVHPGMVSFCVNLCPPSRSLRKLRKSAYAGRADSAPACLGTEVSRLDRGLTRNGSPFIR